MFTGNMGKYGITVKHNLSVSAFDGIVESLNVSGYITRLNGQLSLQIAPRYGILVSVDKDIISKKEAIESQTDKQLLRTSTTIMVDEEFEIVLGTSTGTSKLLTRLVPDTNLVESIIIDEVWVGVFNMVE